MSGGSFNYLCTAEDLASRTEDIRQMVAELDALASESPYAAMAAAETQVVLAAARAQQQSVWDDESDRAPIRSVWHDVEWWRSCDYGKDQVIEGLAEYGRRLDERRPPIAVVYRNHRGDVATRRVRPLAVRFGSTEYHPKAQWLLEVWDVDKQAARTFALADCDFDGADW